MNPWRPSAIESAGYVTVRLAEQVLREHLQPVEECFPEFVPIDAELSARILHPAARPGNAQLARNIC